MNLKNYTSTVSAANSMAKIERCLVDFGATDISKKYHPETRVCTAIRFRVEIKTAESPQLGTPIFFELPAKVDACFKVFWEQVKRPQADTRKKTMEQAERTAWKIISDWVEIQLSMIELEQAELIQVFLPYVYNPQTDKTYYSQIKENNYKALLNG